MASDSSSTPRIKWFSPFRRGSDNGEPSSEKPRVSTWSMGILNDKKTIEVPGSVLLLAKHRNEPLGLRNAPARTSHSSIPVGYAQEAPPPAAEEEKKMTSDGKIILEPQPEDSANDPLNWPTWRRDSALLSLGLYCMIGGGLTPLLAAGFGDVAHDYSVEVEHVSLTTGLYMMGMGLGSVVFSPTAILWGKRPVYLFSSVLLICCSVWCALSPNFVSLLLARIFQGVAVSPVECLPSATIAEIFFLHERAYRIGIYTLLLLGGKNLVPLVSAAIIQRLGWRWAFWMVAIVVGFCGALLFLFVPETFWDRAPTPRAKKQSRPNFLRRLSSRHPISRSSVPATSAVTPRMSIDHAALASPTSPTQHQPKEKHAHVGFAPEADTAGDDVPQHERPRADSNASQVPATHPTTTKKPVFQGSLDHDTPDQAVPSTSGPVQPAELKEKLEALTPAPGGDDHIARESVSRQNSHGGPHPGTPPHPRSSGSNTPRDYYQSSAAYAQHRVADSESQSVSSASVTPGIAPYTRNLRELPARSFAQQLRPFHGRLNKDKWLKVMVRPFILFSYPAVLWSSVVYSCSIGWLIVISESVSVIYRNKESYNFDALQSGLIYISPFIGGILGTAVAGKVSDLVVKRMAARNGGLYEPEFRLVMAAPIAVTTVVGLMGFGWSAEERDAWIVPTVFFGIVSFGCSLGSTTAITFCVDSYRQYAGEALVTLNFSKNIFHGLVFSLFVTGWITSDGPKAVYVWIGVIQLILLVSTVPMYIYGKRARMWTVRKNFMEKF